MSTDNVSAPRLAHLVKGSAGYGFNLHGDKTQPGQTISAVDKDSPAALGGLVEGDVLIEVNGSNVESKSHGDVVKLIKANAGETTLLVCDKVTLAYLKENKRECTVDMANLSCVIEPVPSEEAAPAPQEAAPTPQVTVNGEATEENLEQVVESSAAPEVESAPPPALKQTEDDTTTPDEVKQLNSVLDEEDIKPEPQPEPVESAPVVAEPEPEPVKQAEPEPTPEPAPQPEPVAAEEPAPEPTHQTTTPNDGGLILDMKKAREAAKGTKNRNSVKSQGGPWSNKVQELDRL